jgi:hypothetical protein
MKRFLLIEDHKMKKTAWFVIISLILLFVVTPVMAQNNDELKLGLRRDFGYSSGTGKIQGTFTIKATGLSSCALLPTTTAWENIYFQR